VEALHRLAVAAMRGLLLGKMPMGFALPSASQRGCSKISEQLNIVGKRSGEGFVAHKATLANSLSRALADRLTLIDFNIGRKGFLGYIKALSGSNVVKIVPASSNGDKKLKVVCGNNTSYLEDNDWIIEKTPQTWANVVISPANVVQPNIGSLELAEALNRVLPFTAKEENRPVLQCVLFKAGEGKLQITSSDGFRLAMVSLDYSEGEGQVLVHNDELKGIANALKRARRVRIGFEPSGENLDGMALVIDTEVIHYRFIGTNGTFPDYEKIIPTEHNVMAQLDSVEAVKAVSPFRAVAANPKSYSIDLTIGSGKVVLANPDNKAESYLNADTQGEGYIRIDGKYLADVLKAFGGMVDLTLTNSYSPMTFANDGYKVVVMPMMSVKANEQKEQDGKAKAEAEPEPEAEPTAEAPANEAEPTTEAEAEMKPKRRRSQRKEPVAVA
jgi:DNA polymerase-3 subunit beta